MELVLKLLFCTNIALLISHEMDAIRCKEWSMFIVLKDMKENKGYLAFSIVHIPLYIGLIYLIAYGSTNTINIFSLCSDIFLIFHWAIHYLFRNKQQNYFKSLYSLVIINSMGIISLVHIIIWFINSEVGVL